MSERYGGRARVVDATNRRKNESGEAGYACNPYDYQPFHALLLPIGL